MRRLRVAGRAVQKAAQAQAGDDEELFSPLFERFGWDVDIDPIRGMSGTSASEGKLASPRAFRYKATTPLRAAAGRAHRLRVSTPPGRTGSCLPQIAPSRRPARDAS